MAEVSRFHIRGLKAWVARGVAVLSIVAAAAVVYASHCIPEAVCTECGNIVVCDDDCENGTHTCVSVRNGRVCVIVDKECNVAVVALSCGDGFSVSSPYECPCGQVCTPGILV